MSPAEQSETSDQLLTRYLLGALTEEEAERLDEQSITDEEFALRLDAIEHDLIDAFVRGELSGDAQERFEHFYLSSQRRAEKVEFAKALLRWDEAARRAELLAAKQSPWRWLKVTGMELQWAFGAGAFATLLAAGYLFLENSSLRNEVGRARASQAELGQQEQELQRQIQDQRDANAELTKQLESLQRSQTGVDQIKTFATLLLPPTRGVGGMPTLSLASDTTLVVLLLRVESDEFPFYRVALRDAGTNQVVWQGEKLRVQASGADRIVSISFSARLLKQQSYVVELTGLPRQGPPESLSNYPFKIVIK